MGRELDDGGVFSAEGGISPSTWGRGIENRSIGDEAIVYGVAPPPI
jgi:hypothetical protein